MVLEVGGLASQVIALHRTESKNPRFHRDGIPWLQYPKPQSKLPRG